VLAWLPMRWHRCTDFKSLTCHRATIRRKGPRTVNLLTVAVTFDPETVADGPLRLNASMMCPIDLGVPEGDSPNSGKGVGDGQGSPVW